MRQAAEIAPVGQAAESRGAAVSAKSCLGAAGAVRASPRRNSKILTVPFASLQTGKKLSRLP